MSFLKKLIPASAGTVATVLVGAMIMAPPAGANVGAGGGVVSGHVSIQQVGNASKGVPTPGLPPVLTKYLFSSTTIAGVFVSNLTPGNAAKLFVGSLKVLAHGGSESEDALSAAGNSHAGLTNLGVHGTFLLGPPLGKLAGLALAGLIDGNFIRYGALVLVLLLTEAGPSRLIHLPVTVAAAFIPTLFSLTPGTVTGASFAGIFAGAH